MFRVFKEELPENAIICKSRLLHVMKIRIATFINISDFQFQPVSPVCHSVKFSWFLSEFVVLKVELEDRNLVLALLRKIPGSDGKNIDFHFNYTPE